MISCFFRKGLLMDKIDLISEATTGEALQLRDVGLAEAIDGFGR